MQIIAERNYFLILPFILGAFLSGAFRAIDGGVIPFSLFQIALVVCSFIILLRSIVYQKTEIILYGLEKYYLLLLLVICISIIYTPERNQALLSVTRFSVLILMSYLIINFISTIQDVKFIVYSIIVVSIILGVINIVQTYYNPELVALNYLNQGRKLIRQSGVETDPNIFASNFFIPIMVLISFINSSKSNLKAFVLFILASLIIVPVLLSYSRSAWVSIILSATILITISKNYRLILFLLIGFVLLMIFSEAARSIIVIVYERFIDIFSGTEDDSSKFRIILAYTSILMFLDSYMLGVGYQGFSTVFQKYHPPQETQWIYEPHNDFLAVLAELGIIGFTLFLILIFKILHHAYRNVVLSKNDVFLNSIALGLFGSLICYVVFFQFLSGIFHSSIFFINVGLIFSLTPLIQQRSSESIQMESSN